MTTDTIANVTLTTKANVYFDGKCVSHGFKLADGTAKTIYAKWFEEAAK